MAPLRKLDPQALASSRHNTHNAQSTHKSTTMASLVQGGIYRVRYGTKTSSSTQRKGVRRIEVLVGPHTHERFKHGPVVVVKDLTDPQGPVEKTMYCDRFLTIDLERGISNRFDRQQAGARSLRWSSDEEESDDDGLAVGDLVTVDRRETELFGSHARIRPIDSRRSMTVRRRLLNRTSLASINRKAARMKYGRRRRGVGAIV